MVLLLFRFPILETTFAIIQVKSQTKINFVLSCNNIIKKKKRKEKKRLIRQFLSLLKLWSRIQGQRRIDNKDLRR